MPKRSVRRPHPGGAPHRRAPGSRVEARPAPAQSPCSPRREAEPLAPWDNGRHHAEPAQDSAAARDAGRAHPQLLHHRAHRPWQIDPGRPHAPDDRRRREPRYACPVPRPDGHRARARHHHQVAGRAHALAGRRGRVRPQHDRHPRARRLQLRGLAVPGRLRGCPAARRLRSGHRGADACESLPRDGARSRDHPRAQQDRPAGGGPRPLRGRDREPPRRRPRRHPPGERQVGHRRRRPARPHHRAHPGPRRRPRRARPRDDLRLGLRHLPRRRHLRARGRRRAHRPREDHDVLHRQRPRAARARRLGARAEEGEGPRRRRGGLRHHRREGRAPVEGRRHDHLGGEPRHREPPGLRRAEADGVLGPLPDRRVRLPGAARGARQAQTQRRLSRLRTRDLGGARLRLPLRLPRPPPPRDHHRAALARVRPRHHHHRALGDLRRRRRGRHRAPRHQPVGVPRGEDR